MTDLKEQAVKILQDIPDDKMVYVVKMLNKISAEPDNSSEIRKAVWEDFKKECFGIIPYDIDEKAELAEARDEKYARFN